MSVGKASGEAFLRRYEELKKHWFRPVRGGGGVDEDTGQVVIPLYDRNQLSQMFEQMGVEVPMTPNDKPTFIQRRE